MGQKVSKAVSKPFDRRATIRASRGPTLRQQQISEGPDSRRRRLDQYKEVLARAEQELDERYAANKCPREEIYSFEIKGYLSRGANATVFLAQHRETKVRYALKVQPKEKFRKYNQIKLIVHEKKLLYACQNKFIIEIYFAFQDWKNLYTVMEHAKYGDLLRLIGTKNPKKTVKYFAAQIILGIEYLHACNIVHRDIKPGNIFIASDFYVKIGDFGTAKKVAERTYSAVGTPQYKAPEMFTSNGYGKAVDWWAMGIVIYRLLYIKNPFVEDDTDVRQIASRIVSNELSFPAGVDADAPQNRFISALLQKEPSRRLGQTSGSVDQMRQHRWFEDVSFPDVYDKKITFNATIGPAQPEVNERYDFMPRRKSTDADTNWFQGF